MQKITTFLTFKENGLEAVNFYLSLFKNTKLNYMMRDGSKLQFADFEIDGQHFMAMDGGPEFEFGMGNSLFVNCEDQAEVDNLWAKFTEDGTPGQCGWLTDKYGVSWQIVPKILGELMMDKDPAKADKVMQAMLKMGKLEVSGLQAAYNS